MAVTTVEIKGVSEAGRAIDGPPGLAVIAAMFGAFGDPPELVVSGINSGLNTGPLVLHSGTVGAALTAQNFGASAIAVSLESSDPWRWDTACAFAGDLATWLCDHAPLRTVLSLNVPARSIDDVKGLRWCSLGSTGSVRVAVGDGHSGLQFEFQARDNEDDEQSDEQLVRAGWATVTALRGVTEDRLETDHRLPILVERHVAAAPVAGDVDLAGAEHGP